MAALLSCDAVLGLAPLRYASDQPAAAHQTRSASLASASAPDVWDDGDCTGRPDNWSAADAASKCRRYYRCVAGKKSVYLCPAKNVFNGERCVPPAQHECAAASTTTAAAVSTTPTAVTAPPIESSSEVRGVAIHHHRIVMRPPHFAVTNIVRRRQYSPICMRP